MGFRQQDRRSLHSQTDVTVASQWNSLFVCCVLP